MITAMKARKKYETNLPRVKRKQIKNELADIKRDILYAINKGENYAWCIPIRNEETIEILKEEYGFKVEKERYYFYTIRW